MLFIPASKDVFNLDLFCITNEPSPERLKLPKSQIAPCPMVNVPGEHAEKGVLRNKGLLKTVRPHDDKSMYFIYDEIRDKIFTRDVLIPGLNTQLLGRIQAPIEYNEVRHVSDRQLGATLGLIAKGAPIIDFNVDGPEPKIEYAGRVLILIE